MNAKEFREKKKSGYQAKWFEDKNTAMEYVAYEKYLGKMVKVIKGKKVPIGTVGTMFWCGVNTFEKWDPLGRFMICSHSELRVGIKTNNGKVYFTAEDNIALIEEIA